MLPTAIAAEERGGFRTAPNTLHRCLTDPMHARAGAQPGEQPIAAAVDLDREDFQVRAASAAMAGVTAASDPKANDCKSWRRFIDPFYPQAIRLPDRHRNQYFGTKVSLDPLIEYGYDCDTYGML
jgi:hypothetical protein